MKIYTDASYDDKKGIAGMGIVVCKGQKRRTISNWGSFKSINEAELFAIYLGFFLLGGESCEIITDSQTALQYIERGVRDKPRTKEQYIRHKHCELWAYKIRKFKNCTFTKEKAHTNKFQMSSVWNSLADILSREGRAKFYER